MEAEISQDIDSISNNIIEMMSNALNVTAPAKRIQLQKLLIEFISAETLAIQQHRDKMQAIAHASSLSEDCRIF